MRFETIDIHAGERHDPAYGAVSVPILTRYQIRREV